jgi:hypothetical protein
MANQLFDEQNIIAILGIQNLPDEQKLRIVDKVSELVQKRLLTRLLGALSDKDQETFMQLLNSQEQEPLDDFLNSHVPDFPAWLEEEVNKIKLELADWSSSAD